MVLWLFTVASASTDEEMFIYVQLYHFKIMKDFPNISINITEEYELLS